MDLEITLWVNGAERHLLIDTRTTLLDLLRERLGITGPKKGCDHGQCGACTILLDGRRGNSCLALAVAHQDAQIVTIEGLADGEADDGGGGKLASLLPLQQSFIAHDAFQCGYCTPGMIVNAYAFLLKKAHPTREEILRHMDDNLCRCGSHTRIVDAILEAAGSTKGAT